MKRLKHIIEAKGQFAIAGMTIAAVMGVATVVSAIATSTDSAIATSSAVSVANAAYHNGGGSHVDVLRCDNE